MSKRIMRTQQRLERRMDQICRRAHVEPRAFLEGCVCCRENLQSNSSIDEHLEKHHNKSECQICSDFDTDRCPWKLEMRSLGWMKDLEETTVKFSGSEISDR